MGRSCPTSHGRQRRYLTGASLVAGSVALAVRAAWGGPSDITVRVSCPVLSEVSAAEFEARVKLDLAVRSPRGGELEVMCDDLAAKLRWRERGGLWVARAVPKAPAPAMLIDDLLVVSKDLVDDVTRSSGALGVEASKESAAPVDGGPQERAEAVDANDEREAPPPKAVPPKRAGGRTPTADVPASSSEMPIASNTPGEPWALGVSLGAHSTLFFNSQSNGMLGPSAGVYAQLPAGFVAHLTGEYAFAFGAGDVLSVRAASALAIVVARLGSARALEIGGGAFAGSMFVAAASAYQPSDVAQGFWGLAARARYGLEKGGWRLAAGPDLRFYGFRTEIAVDGAVVWGLPVLSAGLALELSRELYGWR